MPALPKTMASIEPSSRGMLQRYVGQLRDVLTCILHFQMYLQPFLTQKSPNEWESLWWLLHSIKSRVTCHKVGSQFPTSTHQFQLKLWSSMQNECNMRQTYAHSRVNVLWAHNKCPSSKTNSNRLPYEPQCEPSQHTKQSPFSNIKTHPTGPWQCEQCDGTYLKTKFQLLRSMCRCHPSAPGKIFSVKRYRCHEYLAECLKRLDVDHIAQGNNGTVFYGKIVSMRLLSVNGMSKPSQSHRPRGCCRMRIIKAHKTLSPRNKWGSIFWRTENKDSQIDK